jgi:hypothetical protein
VVPRIKQKVFRNWKKFQNRGKKYDNMTYLVELGSTEGARALGSSLILKIECISSAMEKCHSNPIVTCASDTAIQKFRYIPGGNVHI